MKFFVRHWWKILCSLLLFWVVIGGMLIDIPAIPKLNESARNLFYHVPMWYVMIISFLISAILAILFLIKNKAKYDAMSKIFVDVGIYFGILGLVTGMLWASVTWGKPWSNDPKQIGSFLCLLTYMAYVVLRAIATEKHSAKLASVYNIFAFALIIPLLYILPARFESLHPGTTDGPLKALYSQAAAFRKVSLPAMIGWILLGVWIFQIQWRIRKIELKRNEIKP